LRWSSKEANRFGLVPGGIARNKLVASSWKLIAAVERIMATTAKRVKDARKPKFSSRKHNRCKLCGRPRGYLRKFGICRLCFRALALKGEIPGVVKSSW
jgi:small subunit ribosomal protein S14